MKSLDPIARELERAERLAVASLLGPRDFVRGYAQASLGEIDAIKLCGELEQRGIAARRHVGNDTANRLLDVLRRLTLDRKKAAKTLGEIRALIV
jgi:hypothetical protein